MSFKFQINQDVKWNINEEFIKKAEERTPKLFKRKVVPKNIVKTYYNESLIGNYGTEILDSIENLSNYSLGRDEKIILDLGDHYVGNFSVDIESVGSPMDAPLYIRLRFAEVAAELEYSTEDYDGWLSKSWIQEEFIHIDTLPTTLEMPRRYSCRFVEIKVIDTSPKWKATFLNPQFISETSADYQQLKELEIEDEKLKEIHDISVKTLANCMQDVYEDGPKRDRRLWIGDLRLQALANYSTFQDRDLVERCLYLFAGMRTEDGKVAANVFTSPTNIPDDTFLFEYSLNFITTLYEHYEEFKDVEFVKSLYKVAKEAMELAIKHIDNEGRYIEDPDWPIFCDWSSEFTKITAGQAMIIYTLRRFVKLAEIVDDQEITIYLKTLKKMIKFSKEKLFDDDKNLFIIEENREINIASQVWMVLAEVKSIEENKSIMQTAIDKLFPITGIATPYMYHHINEALFVAGLNEEGEQFLKDYWGKMIDMGADTFWEAFDPDKPNYSPYGSPMINSYCHAWSCTPSYLIEKYILK